MAENPPPNIEDYRPRGEPVIFSYAELQEVTKYFHPNSITGRGAFGTVYKGKLKSGQTVAVKKIDANGMQSNMMFLQEVFLHSILRHPNIINLIGFAPQSPQQHLLVYEFMPSESLDIHLHDLKPTSELLDWETRMTIALGTAKALDYLHNEAKPPVVFHGLCPGNILLDESFHPRLSGFRFAEYGPTPVPTAVKSDVYGFGFVLFELITGRKPEDVIQPDVKLFDWLNSRRSNLDEVVDIRLGGEYTMPRLRKAADVALACLHENHLIRPDMGEVVRALKDI